MQCRLGRFEVASSRGRADAARLQLAQYLIELQRHASAASAEDRAAIEQRLRQIRQTVLPDPTPCLMESLPLESPDRPWLGEVLAALDDAQGGGARVELLACDAADGPEAPIVVAAVARDRSAEVRPRDIVCAGFAARRVPGGELEVFPRLYRVACANGAIWHHGTLPARASQPGGLRAELATMLGRPALEAEVAWLREAAAMPVADPVELLQKAQVSAVVIRQLQPAIDRLDVTGGSPAMDGLRAHMLWEFVNIVTAHARRLRDWSARLDLERRAGGMLAVLRRPQPAHPLGLALQPPCDGEPIEVHA